MIQATSLVGSASDETLLLWGRGLSPLLIVVVRQHQHLMLGARHLVGMGPCQRRRSVARNLYNLPDIYLLYRFLAT